ncbi:Dynein assembly factor 1 [Quillaja saponaria]|uniref:Dynein assembly factor 1 n=1 Tax=Quillaja saponaria TaxID=32244 RepID=A0AAD7LWT9_QUISA|nr:Dynein assembly factor 1 [Quillaja saponaria]KAJ7965723.1 Dynein assembly factor 1 [Quillaja saponaria]
MAKCNCFTVSIGRKKKYKGGDGTSKPDEYNKGSRTLQVKIEKPGKAMETDESTSTTFGVPVPFSIQKNSRCNVKVMSLESPAKVEAAEDAYEGEDEHEELSSIKRDFSDFDLQGREALACEEEKEKKSSDSCDVNYQFEDKNEIDREKDVDMLRGGHLSDPGIGKPLFWASPMLKRSCSNVEGRDFLKKLTDQFPPSRSQSFEELQELSERAKENVNIGLSPKSVMSHCSADRVMLKKHSSSQILPSRSRRLWWKLFLWSHRNLHRPLTKKPTQSLLTSAALNKHCGYSSDTLEPKRAIVLRKLESPGSFTREPFNKGFDDANNDARSWDGFQNGGSGLWPQNQWVAFSTESSSFARVDEWVKDLETQDPLPVDDNDNDDESIVFPPSPETGKSPAISTTHWVRHPDVNLSEEILHANSIVQSLNSASTVAHISGIGLKATPMISQFSSLRAVNLSSNFIVHITPGSLPKGLHILNLSRNKISTIEGLKDLSRLRVLDLSYNRISRIGQGLSNSTLIKELYMAGNKISDVEGLHRLLKLTIFDLSFNKITTTKALGQLVANYNSLQALNLLGNPIQSNISDDQLRKAVCGLLPKLVYLNKQPVKPQRAREVLKDNVAKAALGNSSRSSLRKAVKRSGQGGSVSSLGHRNSASAGQKNRNRSRSRTHHQFPLKATAHGSTSVPR